MKIRIWFSRVLLIWMLTGSYILKAQEVKNISLQEAIDLATSSSKQLRVSNARIQEATAVLQEANDRRLPDFKVSGSYLRLNSANVDLKTRNNNSGNTGNSGGGIDVNQALYGTANLSYPLFTGGKIKFGIESAKYLKRASELDAEHNKEEVAFNATNAYVNLYKAAEAVKLVKENLTSARSRDTIFYNLERNGLLARNDLLKSQLQSSNIELSLLDAQTNSKLSTINMNLLLGLPENTLLNVDSTFIDTVLQVKPFADLESTTLQNRNDVQALEFRKKSAATSIKSAKAEAFPSIALTGGYVAAYVPNVITVTNAINVGIGIQYNLANIYKKNSRLSQAKANLAEVQANTEILNDAIRSQVNKDFENYLLSNQKIAVYQKAVEQATENYRITNNKYNNNLVTISDLLDADVALLQANLNIRFAKADAILSYYKLLQTTGTITKGK